MPDCLDYATRQEIDEGLGINDEIGMWRAQTLEVSAALDLSLKNLDVVMSRTEKWLKGTYNPSPAVLKEIRELAKQTAENIALMTDLMGDTSWDVEQEIQRIDR